MIGIAAKLRSDAMPHMTAREIAADIAERIDKGEYAPGERLVYEDLIQLYGVSRSTIQRTMSRLEVLGAVEYRPGRGMFVTE